jgi:ribosomal 50S subunit-recycling heat shock protein
MRIDLTLKYLCLVKSRSIAKSLCERRLVLVDGKPARPATRVGVGSRVTVHLRSRTYTIELLDIPRKQLSKTAAVDYYLRVETPQTDARPGGDAEDDWDSDAPGSGVD